MKISTRGSPCAERVFFRRVLGHKHEEQGCFGAARATWPILRRTGRIQWLLPCNPK